MPGATALPTIALPFLCLAAKSTRWAAAPSSLAVGKHISLGTNAAGKTEHQPGSTSGVPGTDAALDDLWKRRPVACRRRTSVRRIQFNQQPSRGPADAESSTPRCCFALPRDDRRSRRAGTGDHSRHRTRWQHRQAPIGGPWGDAGIQIPGVEYLLFDNSAEERVSNIFSHHHPLDGAIINGPVRRIARSHFDRLICETNGRQGLSIVGGSGYDFEDCMFSRTGRSVVSSPPGAGVDIEAEDSKVRDVTFKNCKFIDNIGAGAVADSGDSADIHFTDCLFNDDILGGFAQQTLHVV